MAGKVDYCKTAGQLFDNMIHLKVAVKQQVGKGGSMTHPSHHQKVFITPPDPLHQLYIRYISWLVEGIWIYIVVNWNHAACSKLWNDNPIMRYQ